jgi:Arc/MetJ family transcription regulator
MARTVIDLDDELVASVAKELGTSTKKDTVNAAADGAFDLALLQDKQNYRR